MRTLPHIFLGLLLSTTLAGAQEKGLKLVEDTGDGWPQWRITGRSVLFATPGRASHALHTQKLNWFLDSVESLSPSDVAILEARKHYLQGRLGAAFESLEKVPPYWSSYARPLLQQTPLTARLLAKGWVPQRDMIGLRKNGTTLKLTPPPESQGARSLTLDGKKALVVGENILVLPHLHLALKIHPPLERDTLTHDLAGAEGVTEQLGTSVQGKPIIAHRLGSGEETVIFFGAFHGDEPESTLVVEKLLQHLQENPELLQNRTAVLVPVVNPDGLEAGQRKNANEVDLNRNYPTSNWNSEGKDTDYWGGTAPASEPETKIVVELLERYKPDRIISIHCPYKCVNYDGPAERLAKIISEENGYKVEPSIGYPTPGSFGTYAGIEGNIPTITLELPPTGEEDVWEDNRSALVRALRGSED